MKRINEIIANLKAQKIEIKNILGKITDIQKDTDALIEQIKKLDVEVEDYIFNEAKKDKIAKEIYKEITKLKDDFDKLTTNIQEQNKLKSTIREGRSRQSLKISESNTRMVLRSRSLLRISMVSRVVMLHSKRTY